MTRATRFAACAAGFATLYALLCLELISVPHLDAEITAQLLPVVRIFPGLSAFLHSDLAHHAFGYKFPWWFLVSFGSYSLYSLGRGLYTFNDTPDAYEELMKEISEAKNDLRAKGVSVD